jgi:hypothetical protein
LRQIIEDKDAQFLECCIRPFLYETEEEALAVIAGYERFVSENEDACYVADAKPARTRDSSWKILFKSIHPWDAEEARYQ